MVRGFFYETTATELRASLVSQNDLSARNLASLSADSPDGSARPARLANQTTSVPDGDYIGGVDLTEWRKDRSRRFRAIISLVNGARFVAKFIIGVVVGIFLGATGGAYGAGALRHGTLSGWTVTKDGEAITISDRPLSAGRASKS